MMPSAATVRNTNAIVLQCPACKAALPDNWKNVLECISCGKQYRIFDSIPALIVSASNAGWIDYFEGLAQNSVDGKVSYAPGNAPHAEFQFSRLRRAYQRSLARWLTPGSRVLDLGCGHGQLLKGLDKQYELYGADYIPAVLPLARQNGYRVYQADATALPFAANQFDGVVCSEVLQHFENATPVISELVRVCKPGGTILISTVNDASVVRKVVRGALSLFKTEVSKVPILRRHAHQLVDAARGLPADVHETAWVLSPAPAVAFRSGAESALAPLATNYILGFRKAL